MKVGSTFTGIGGIPLATRMAGFQLVSVAEIEPYTSALLKQHFPDVPNRGDVRLIPSVGSEDIFTCGFPCQDISGAGAGAWDVGCITTRTRNARTRRVAT